MQCSVTFFFFFFHSTRETLFNRECESEWLIHKWDPDSGSEKTDTTVGCVVRVATTSGCLMPAKTHRSIGFRFHDTAPAKMHVEGGRRDSRLAWSPVSVARAGTLAHGGDHTGRVVRSEGEAGRRVHRRGRGQHVAGVAEGRDVTERRHVSGEGSGVERAALGEVLQRIVHLFALFGFARHFSVSGLDPFLLHSQGSVNLNRDHFFFFFLLFFGWL